MVNDHETAIQLKNGMSEWVYDKMIPCLNRLYDNTFQMDEVVVLDKIEIDLGEVSFKNIEKDFLAAIENKVSDIILSRTYSKNLPKGNVQEEEDLTILHSDNEALIHFLELGLMPWWHRHASIKTLVESVFKTSLQKLIQFLRQGPSDEVWKRIFLHFPKEKIQSLLIEANPSKLEEIIQLRKILTELKVEEINDAVFHIEAYKYVVLTTGNFATIVSNTVNRYLDRIQQFGDPLNVESIRLNLTDKIKSLIHESPLKIDLSNWDFAVTDTEHEEHSKGRIKKEEGTSISETEELLDEKINVLIENGLLIQHSGLIILAPYLQAFFKKTGLVDKSGFISEKAQERAVLFCEYLATGETNIDENKAVFSKILCGLKLSKSIENRLNLTPSEKEETHSLLASLIENWSALGKVSIHGLRTGFLQREGRIISSENRYILKIERLGRDILLDKLPWNIAIVRLPWMDKVLEVEW